MKMLIIEGYQGIQIIPESESEKQAMRFLVERNSTHEVKMSIIGLRVSATKSIEEMHHPIFEVKVGDKLPENIVERS